MARNLSELSSLELARYRSRTVGMVFQSFNLLPRMTLEENVELPLRLAEVDRAERGARVQEALERVHLEKRLTHRPSELSGGEQQRAALARALVNRPTLLFADEPTGNLGQRYRRIHHASAERNSAKAGHDDCDGDARTATGGAVCGPHRRACGWEIADRRGEIMKAGDLGELALRNLREAVLRSSLTTLGVAVGVASLVAWLSLGIGLQALATKRLSNSGLFDTVIVTQRRNVQSMRRPPAESSPAKNARLLDDDAKNELERLPNVVEVYSQVRFPTEVRYDGTPYSTIVAGIPASARGNGSFDGIQGSFFSGPNADEAILQIEFAKDLSTQPSNLIGKDLVVRYAERQALPPQAGGSPGANSG